MKTTLIVIVSIFVGAISASWYTYHVLNKSGEATIDYLLTTTQVANLEVSLRLLDLPDEDMRCKMYKHAAVNAGELRSFEITETKIIGAPGLPAVTKRHVDKVLAFYENSEIAKLAECKTDAKLY